MIEIPDIIIDGKYIMERDIPKLKKWLIEYEMNEP